MADHDAAPEFESPSDLPPNESWRDIRPVAIGVVRRGDDVLVFEARDETEEARSASESSSVPARETKAETFYRPPGGGLQFGEPAADAVVREFDEELGWTVSVEERLAVVENIFTFDGTPGHEYDVVFEVAPEDAAVYDQDEFVGTESDGAEFRVCWKPLADFRGDDTPPLYPDGLVDVLE